MVTGVIDLVFEHGGRFYVADYKSNLLGRRFDDYAPQALRGAMLARRYDLQYLLYTLALHRWLATRLADYDPARHLGGVYYLFLRGMRPETGPDRGVFFAPPEPALIDALDKQALPWGDAAPAAAEGLA
jgi:exodeoxyribonuclease V beta subunit